MKFIISGFVICGIVISGIIFNLFTKGIALRSVGVIKPTLIGSDSHLVAKSLALRLFPEFQSMKNVIWVPEQGLETFVDEIILQTAKKLKDEKTDVIPEIISVADAENQPVRLFTLSENYRWWKFPADWEEKLDFFKKNFSNQDFDIIFISTFNRNQPFPTECEDIKILNQKCLSSVAVREVHKKLKSDQPYFFMRRYQDNEFYLFIEKNKF